MFLPCLPFWRDRWRSSTSRSGKRDLTPGCCPARPAVGGFRSRNHYASLAGGHLPAVEWTAIAAQAGNIAIVAVLSVVNLLLYASALELTVGRDIDLNHELKRRASPASPQGWRVVCRDCLFFCYQNYCSHFSKGRNACSAISSRPQGRTILC